MRTALMTAALAAAALTGTAQKYDRENLEYNNTHLPSKLIYDQIKTYGYNVQVYGGDPSGLSASSVTSMLYNFKSFDRRDYVSADMKITLTAGPFSYVGEKTLSRTVEEEVNKVKTKYTKYRRVYEYRYPVRVEVVNAKNNVRLYFNEYAQGNVRSFEGSEFNSETEAIGYFDKVKGEYLKNHITGHIGEFVKGTNNAFSDSWDFYPTTNHLSIFQFKKWDKDDEYNKYVSHVKQVMKNMTAGENVELYKEKLKDDITYFKSFEGVFRPDDKKEDILYFGNYMNLATLHYCIDDMEKAEFYLAKLDSSDKKEGMTNMLKSYIRIAKARMAKHALATTHLDYNPVSDYRLAGKSFTSDALSAAENIINGLGAEGLAKAGDVVKFSNGTTGKGKVVFYAESNTLKLIPADKPDAPVTLNPDNTVSFNMDSVQYISAKVKTANVVKMFFKVKYASEKISLLGVMSPDFTEAASYGALRPREELVTMMGGFGLKRDLAKYFEDCPEVSKKAKDGDYVSAMNTDIRKFVLMCEDYSNCGKTAGTN